MTPPDTGPAQAVARETKDDSRHAVRSIYFACFGFLLLITAVICYQNPILIQWPLYLESLAWFLPTGLALFSTSLAWGRNSKIGGWLLILALNIFYLLAVRFYPHVFFSGTLPTLFLTLLISTFVFPERFLLRVVFLNLFMQAAAGLADLPTIFPSNLELEFFSGGYLWIGAGSAFLFLFLATRTGLAGFRGRIYQGILLVLFLPLLLLTLPLFPGLMDGLGEAGQMSLIILVDLAVVLAVPISTWATRPIRETRVKLEELTTSETGYPLHFSELSEVEEVRHITDHLATDLRELRTDLDRRVEIRTVDIQKIAEVGREISTILMPSLLVETLVKRLQAAFPFLGVRYFTHEESSTDWRLVCAAGLAAYKTVPGDQGRRLEEEDGHRFP
jgi:hypothetical protein